MEPSKGSNIRFMDNDGVSKPIGQERRASESLSGRHDVISWAVHVIDDCRASGCLGVLKDFFFFIRSLFLFFFSLALERM